MESVKFSLSVVSDSFRAHGPQHTRLPCPSPTLGACSNSCPWKSMMSFNYLILFNSLLFLPSIFPRVTVFSKESVLPSRWPNYWSFRFTISPPNEYHGILLNNEKEQTSYSQPGWIYGELDWMGKNSKLKGNVLYDSIFKTFLKCQQFKNVY